MEMIDADQNLCCGIGVKQQSGNHDWQIAVAGMIQQQWQHRDYPGQHREYCIHRTYAEKDRAACRTSATF